MPTTRRDDDPAPATKRDDENITEELIDLPKEQGKPFLVERI